SEHPLSRSISWGTLTIGSAYRFSRLPGADAIVEASDAPLIEARTTLTGREVRVGFDLGRSNLPDGPGFPVFVSNLLHWIAPDLGSTVEPPCIVGKSCAVDPRLLGAEIVPIAAASDSGNAAVDAGVPGSVLPAVPREVSFLPRGYDAQFIPDRAGIYRLRRNGLTRVVAVNAGEREAKLP